ncbi:50S ribosomal protein L11 methyltransferase [Pseudomarimonas salicorniae]|uniref:Ribosomal protein L11 methyltransferase n=1 Tax=Pseudomarimonas salicorniae TaxID=2933270 RepID=A0ABT0GCF2_9GAMM|nr:50S ribosomal protein L11 methyltransferase [Lysobacter sp. CAU 1642]MCK7592219.1 50S ribosomal protein L11 methyltransferase [Lysobacter sp. CAU 1642]
MPHLELTLRCREAEQHRYEHALEDVGALAVTLLDADAETPNERAILEPGVGETPLWAEITLNALFDHQCDREAILLALEAFDADLDLSSACWREVADQDWERAWLDQYQPMQFGERLWIYPWNIEPEGLAAGAVVLRLDPGLAFGSGTHPTTALCLQWLQEQALADTHVLDFGCGSGVLAIAALKLGAARADGIDNDPQALAASQDNADRNGVADRLALFDPESAPDRSYPVVVANILAGTLDTLAEVIAARCEAGGRLAMSGILHGQHEALLERFAPWFEDFAVARQEDWVRISARRR